MSERREVWLHDGFGNPLNSLSGALNIHDADVHNYVVNKYFHQHTGVETTLAVATVGDGTEYTLTLVSATGFAIGDYIHIGNGIHEDTHPKINNIVGNVLTLDRRIDFAHAIGTPILKVYIDMATTGLVGTMASPQEYYIAPAADDIWHITRILLTMVHGTAGDFGLFGNLPSLTNGVLIRARINGQYYTFTNWKNNGDISLDMYDVKFDVRSGGGGQYGTSGRGTFLNAGAVVRLDGSTNDRLEIYIQDDVTALDFFAIKAQGHNEGI